MIPREILKKIRQIELRTNRPVNELPRCVRLRIPTEFCPKAQGCEERATLGQHPVRCPNRNAVAARLSAGGAAAGSPRRKPCEHALRIPPAPAGATESLLKRCFAAAGADADAFGSLTHGSRRGLPSA